MNKKLLAGLAAASFLAGGGGTAIRDALVTYVHGHWRSALDTVLGPLVKNHTITQAQAAAVITAFSQGWQNHGGDHDHHSMP